MEKKQDREGGRKRVRGKEGDKETEISRENRRQHSSRMGIARFPTIHASIATSCQYQLRVDPQVNKFELVFSDGYQMSLARGSGAGGSDV